MAEAWKRRKKTLISPNSLTGKLRPAQQFFWPGNQIVLRRQEPHPGEATPS